LTEENEHIEEEAKRPLPEILQQKLDNLPKSSGVYQFKNKDGKIIYIGKAKSLRSRVHSYFQKRGSGDPKTDVLVAKIADLELVVTDSDVEALLLENNLIKEHTPRYNVRLKDDKSYPYIVVTNEPYPRIFPTRQVRRDGSRYYGPYTDVKTMHLMLRTIRGIFPIRSCDYALNDENVAVKKYKICLDYHIDKCLGPCEGIMSKEDYRTIIDQSEQLLKGKTRNLAQELEQEMQQASESLEFEKAARLRDRIESLTRYRDKQKVATSDFADRDLVAVSRQNDDAVGMVFRVRDGKIVGKQHFTFTSVELESDDAIMEYLVQRYYTKTMDIPPEVLLPIELESGEALLEWLNERSDQKVVFAVPKIGEKAKLLRMCASNARYILDGILLQKMKSDDFIPRSVQALQRDLRLEKTPRRIECFDISHLQGSETVASMVSFLDGKPRKSEYRKYNIKTVEGVDDFASMREVVRRRYSRLQGEGTPLPDLIVVDGGKGQLSSAVEALWQLKIENQLIIGLAKRLEEVFVPGESLPLTIPKTSSGIHLLQRIRDEAHRFAITFHREKRSKATLQTELEQIEGIGPKRAMDMLEKLGSVKAVREADDKELAEIIGWTAAKSVYAYFHEEYQPGPDDGPGIDISQENAESGIQEEQEKDETLD
jgi:excinuclease ABC subunit C